MLCFLKKAFSQMTIEKRRLASILSFHFLKNDSIIDVTLKRKLVDLWLLHIKKMMNLKK